MMDQAQGNEKEQKKKKACPCCLPFPPLSSPFFGLCPGVVVMVGMSVAVCAGRGNEERGGRSVDRVCMCFHGRSKSGVFTSLTR